jgi:uncharacterized protein
VGSVARYVAWCRRRASAIIAAHLVIVAIATALIAFRLPLYADFSYLLPQDAPAVRDLRKLEARVKTPDIVLVVIEAPTAPLRAAATAELATAIAAFPRDLVERVIADDAEQRAFLRAHRYLLVPLDDLVAARDGLARYLHAAKLAANPLFIDLEDHPVDRRELDDLRAKRQRAESQLDRSSSVSANGLVGKLEIRSAFRSTDPEMGHRLLAALDDVRARIVAAHPGVAIGVTGSVVFAAVEHDAIAHGIALSSLVTTLLVALVLALYFRSATLLVLLVVTIAVATVASFGAAALTVGHLNAATAFLGAVIAGNGINYGIILTGRYLEERRHRGIDEALATALSTTARPTAVASLCAAVSYGALGASSFTGFGDFAAIGGVGMLLCWVTTYVLLPALILRFGHAARMREGETVFATLLVKLFGFWRSRMVAAVALVAAVAATAVVLRYVAADPFEYDGKQLRAETAEAVIGRHWLSVSDHEFGRAYTGRTFIAADDAAQVPRIVAALRAREATLPESQRVLGEIDSILDVVPADQPKKLVVLADLRRLLDDDALDSLDDRDRDELRALRPPDDLQPITVASLPASLREPLTELDGRVGLLVSVRPADSLDDWNGHDMVRFGDAVQLADRVTTSGSSVIFVDVLQSIERDTPIVTALAALGIVVVVLVIVGRNRSAAAVLAATGAGALLMVATCALLGIKANFLNFIALPITLGLGVDYAINVAQRAAREDPIATLRTTGSAVFVCSLTTIIGYASLLFGGNLTIRSFGLAALVGEVTTVVAALVLVPALLALGRRSR